MQSCVLVFEAFSSDWKSTTHAHTHKHTHAHSYNHRFLSQSVWINCPCLFFKKPNELHFVTASAALNQKMWPALENVFFFHSRLCLSNWFIYTKKAVASLCRTFHVGPSLVCSSGTWQHYQLSYHCSCWQDESNCYETGFGARLRDDQK